MVHRMKFGLNHPQQATFSVCSKGKARITNKELMPQQRNLLCPSCFQPSIFIVEASQKSIAKFASFTHLLQHRVPQMTFCIKARFHPSHESCWESPLVPCTIGVHGRRCPSQQFLCEFLYPGPVTILVGPKQIQGSQTLKAKINRSFWLILRQQR